jgi:Mg-chelatase subunit ChlD
MTVTFAQPGILLALVSIPLFYALWLRFRKPEIRSTYRVPQLMRALSLSLLVAAAAGPSLGTVSDRVNVIYLLDASDSVADTAQEEGLAFVRRSAAGAGEQDRVGLVSFAADTGVETLPQGRSGDFALRSELDRSGTDIERAIYRGLGLFPSEGQNRLVLLTDGGQTAGDARRAAKVAASAGVELYTVPIRRAERSRDVLIKELIAPEETRVDEPHELRLVLHSGQKARATVTIARDGSYWGEETVNLEAGETVLRYTGLLEEPGLHTYSARIRSESDVILQNNREQTVVRVAGPPAVLYVHGGPNPAQPLLSALRTQGMNVRVVSVENIPERLRQLARFDATILDNVPAYELSLERMRQFERYVRDLGKGFVMVGGDSSYGAGGYYGTPVERLLPVDMDVTSSMQIPSLAMAFVIDKSGSMGNSTSDGATKLDVVKEAVLSSVEIMNPYYQVGLLAFDAEYEWSVPLTRAGDAARIQRDLAGLRSGGGTVLGPALRDAFARLRETDAAVKHIVILSDGLTSDENFRGLTETIRRTGITVSTVSVGVNADRRLLAAIAEWGGGRSYYTDTIQKVPRIFAAETNLVSRNLIVEEPFVPEARNLEGILRGFADRRFPILDGFVLTYPKPAAREIVSAIRGNPLLAAWQYGLGRSAAFTSDMHGRWSQQLLRWEHFPQFAGQLLRWAQPADPDGTLDIDVRREGGVAQVTMEARRVDGSFRNGLSPEARVLGPEEQVDTVRFRQSAPGRYEAAVDAGKPGVYLLSISDPSDGSELTPVSYGFSVGYSREYAMEHGDPQLLRDLAETTGGTTLEPLSASGNNSGAETERLTGSAAERTGESRSERGNEAVTPETLFRADTNRVTDRVSLLMPLLIVALTLLLVELLLSYIIYPGRETLPDRSPAGPEQEPDASTPGATGDSAPQEPRETQRVREPSSYEEARSQVIRSYNVRRSTPTATPEWYREDPENEVAARKIFRLKGLRRRSGADRSRWERSDR